MKHIAITLSFVLLCACGGSTPPPGPTPPTPSAIAYPNVHPGNQYWMMADGSWDEYEYQSYTGTVDSTTFVVIPDPTSITPLSQTRFTNIPTIMPTLPGQMAEARVQTPEGVAATAVPALLPLIERETTQWIGEAANQYENLTDPPEPYITVSPVVGEIISYPGRWRYQTVSMATAYDGFANAVVTTTEELSPETVYMWVFSNGHLVEEWIAPVNPDNSVSAGSMLKWIGSGQNP